MGETKKIGERVFVRNADTTHFLLYFKKSVHRGRKEGYNAGIRTNMFLPVGVSENGLVASVSFTVAFSGSLSPGLTWRVARSSAMCAWTAMVGCVAKAADGSQCRIFGTSSVWVGLECCTSYVARWESRGGEIEMTHDSKVDG